VKPTKGEKTSEEEANSQEIKIKQFYKSQNAQTSSEEIGTSYASEFSRKNTTRFYIIVRFFNQSQEKL
jgi:hypothetical protein